MQILKLFLFEAANFSIHPRIFGTYLSSDFELERFCYFAYRFNRLVVVGEGL